MKNNADSNSTDTTGTFKINGVDLQEWSAYYFHVVAFDADTEFVLTGSLGIEGGTSTHIPVVDVQSIPNTPQTNNGLTYDLTPPSMEFSTPP